MKIKINPDKCSGCKLCEIACSLHHTNTVNPERARVKVYIGDKYSLPVYAGPFTDVACNSRGTLVFNGEEIDICQICRASCPAKFVFKEPDTGIPLKCDFCGEPPDPQCVKWCPSGALTLIEDKQPAEQKK